MPARRPYHHGDLRAALLKEAAHLVETDGVAALTLRELSRRLGVSHAAPLNHFADKDALLAEIAAQGFTELGDALEHALSAASKSTWFYDLGRAYLDFARKRPGHYRVMFGQGAPRSSMTPHLGEAATRAYNALEVAVVRALGPARARSPEKVRRSAFLAWSVVHGAAMLLLDAPLPTGLGVTSEAVARDLTDAAFAAVGASINGIIPSRAAPNSKRRAPR